MEAYLIEAEAYSSSEPYLSSASGSSWHYTLSDSPGIELYLTRHVYPLSVAFRDVGGTAGGLYRQDS